MKTLALEFSSPRRSVALVETVGSEAPVVAATAAETAGRATRAFYLIRSVLSEAGWSRDQIELVALGLGPGSYHGIRCAIAIAEGWALGRSIKLVGISSVSSIATMRARQGVRGAFSVVVDAQRGEFYRADYSTDDGTAREIAPLRLVGAAEVEACIRNGLTVCGPEAKRWFAGAEEVFPDAGIVGCLAAAEAGVGAGARIEPIYLRQTSFVKAPPPRFAPR